MASPQDSLGDLAGDIAPTRYRPLRALARGGMGEVYVVEHVELATQAVMKLLRSELIDVPELSQRLRAEARLLTGLSHDNLVRVLDFGWTRSKRAFLVTELLHGESLGDRLKREKTVPVRMALEITRQLLAGLAKVHAAGIVHRDVKPDNLFLCEVDASASGPAVHLKILDFGIAKVMTPEARARAGTLAPTESGLLIGTPTFLSPEQAKGEPVEARADLYSVGCVVYRMIAGRPPFVKIRPIDLLGAHILETALPLRQAAGDHVPPELDAFVARAMEKAPEDRFASAREMGEALEQIIAGIDARERARTERLPAAFRPSGATELMARPTARDETPVIPRSIGPDGDSAHGTVFGQAPRGPTGTRPEGEDEPTRLAPPKATVSPPTDAARVVGPASSAATLILIGVAVGAVILAIIVAWFALHSGSHVVSSGLDELRRFGGLV